MGCRNLPSLSAIALVTALAASPIGCGGTDGGYYVPYGRLTLSWTINGTTDPEQCSQGSAATFFVRIVYADGTVMGDYAAQCDAFATTIDLEAADYSGQALLEDSAQNPSTTSIDIAPFTIFDGGEFVIPLDFPASSFLQ